MKFFNNYTHNINELYLYQSDKLCKDVIPFLNILNEYELIDKTIKVNTYVWWNGSEWDIDVFNKKVYCGYRSRWSRGVINRNNNKIEVTDLLLLGYE